MIRPILLSFALAAPSLAGVYTITNDTYADSFVYTVGSDTIDFRRTNYGNSGAIKAVSNNGSGSQYPGVNSLVHGYFTLPAAAFTELGTSLNTAVVSFRVRNNSLAGRGVELFPLTRGFVEGTGGTPSTSQGGTSNLPTPLGADWLTYDGTNNWTTPGGDFNSSVTPALSTLRTEGSVAYLDFNLEPLLSNPTARAQLQANGLMMRVTSETNFTGNEFASLWTGETTNAPTVAIPEPTSLAVLAAGSLLLSRRRNA